MDDNHKPTLTESQFEWAWKLVQILQPLIYEGIQSIFQEALKICKVSEEDEKYLMTFQNFLSRIPKWNETMIQAEVDRIVEKSGCTYLDDLITCVHIVHLKILTSIRTGKTQKKIDIAIPKLGKFVHKVYVNLSRELYSNVYLFELDVQPMVFQKNRAAFNKLIRSAILDAVRGSIPVENLLRAYLDESTDLLKEEIKDKEPLKEIEIAETTAPKKSIPVEVVDIGPIVEMSKELEKDPVLNIIDIAKEPTIRFMDKDSAISVAGVPELIHAPKDDETLKRIAEQRASDRKEQESSDTLSISDENIITDLPIEVLV
jgi:hypothetical protein